FPEPLAPRMIFVWPRSSVKLTSRNTTLSSKASETWSKTTIGGMPPDGCAARRASTAVIAISVQELHQQRRQEEVGGDDHHRSGDDRVGGGPSDALRAARRPHADVTPDRADHEAEHHRLDQTLPRVAQEEAVDNRRPVGTGPHAQFGDRDQPAGQNR